MNAHGYFPPSDLREDETPWWGEESAKRMRINNPEILKHWEECVAEAPAKNARREREHAEMVALIATLPASMRGAMEKWMAWRPLNDEEGWLVRQALLLMGRRRAAA